MKELIKKTPKELVQLLSEKREALRVFRFALSGSKTKNIKEGQNLRKDIARIMTILNK
jgi:ribosomal protein L29